MGDVIDITEAHARGLELPADRDAIPLNDPAREAAKREARWLSMRDLLAMVMDELQKPKPDRGLLTGFGSIDRFIGGFRPGNITIFGAKRGFGKSSFGNAIIEKNVADHEVALYAGEDPAMMYGKRFLAKRANINALKLRDLDPPDENEWKRIADAVQNAPTNPFFCEVQGRPVEWIAGSLRKLAAERKEQGKQIRLVIVDYLQCIAVATRQQDRRNDIDYILKTLCDATREVGAAGLFFSQLKRTERNEPDLEDLKESSTLEEKADHIILGWKVEEEYKDKHGHDRKRAHRWVKIAKNKDGVDASEFNPVELYFENRTAAFTAEVIPPEGDRNAPPDPEEDPDAGYYEDQ